MKKVYWFTIITLCCSICGGLIFYLVFSFLLPNAAANDTTNIVEQIYASEIIAVTEVELNIGESKELLYDILPSTSNQTVMFESLNEDIASVTNEGIVYAYNVGETYIFIKVKCNAYEYITKDILIKVIEITQGEDQNEQGENEGETTEVENQDEHDNSDSGDNQDDNDSQTAGDEETSGQEDGDTEVDPDNSNNNPDADDGVNNGGGEENNDDENDNSNQNGDNNQENDGKDEIDTKIILFNEMANNHDNIEFDFDNTNNIREITISKLNQEIIYLSIGIRLSDGQQVSFEIQTELEYEISNNMLTLIVSQVGCYEIVIITDGVEDVTLIVNVLSD